MNFLAGWCLLFVSEEDAFWMLAALVEDCCVGYYTSTMIGARVSLNLHSNPYCPGPAVHRTARIVQTL